MRPLDNTTLFHAFLSQLCGTPLETMPVALPYEVLDESAAIDARSQNRRSCRVGGCRHDATLPVLVHSADGDDSPMTSYWIDLCTPHMDRLVQWMRGHRHLFTDRLP